MKLHPCAQMGCGRLVPMERRYCDAHQLRADTEAARHATQRWTAHHEAHPDWSAVYRTTRWRKLRAAHLREHPLCVACGKPGRKVDHIIPHRGDERLAFDPSNLQTLCDACDARKTRRDR